MQKTSRRLLLPSERKNFQKEDNVRISDHEKYDNEYEETISELAIRKDLVILDPKKIFPEEDVSTSYETFINSVQFINNTRTANTEARFLYDTLASVYAVLVLSMKWTELINVSHEVLPSSSGNIFLRSKI